MFLTRVDVEEGGGNYWYEVGETVTIVFGFKFLCVRTLMDRLN